MAYLRRRKSLKAPEPKGPPKPRAKPPAKKKIKKSSEDEEEEQEQNNQVTHAERERSLVCVLHKCMGKQCPARSLLSAKLWHLSHHHHPHHVQDAMAVGSIASQIACAPSKLLHGWLASVACRRC